MVEDGAFSQKLHYVTILNLKGHPNRINGSRVKPILFNVWDLSQVEDQQSDNQWMVG